MKDDLSTTLWQEMAEQSAFDTAAWEERVRLARRALSQLKANNEPRPDERAALPRFRLLAGRPSRIEQHGGQCPVCERWEGRLTPFTHTSWGEVSICADCQNKAELERNPKSAHTEVNLRHDGKGWRQ